MNGISKQKPWSEKLKLKGTHGKNQIKMWCPNKTEERRGHAQTTNIPNKTSLQIPLTGKQMKRHLELTF